MNAPSWDIKDLLASAGLGAFGATSGWAIAISREPTSPHTCITIYDTPGFEPLYDGGIEHPTVQVRVRGAPNDYLGTYAKAKAVKETLIGTNVRDINGAVYTAWITGDVAHLGYDESSRPIFIANYRLMRSDA